MLSSFNTNEILTDGKGARTRIFSLEGSLLVNCGSQNILHVLSEVLGAIARSQNKTNAQHCLLSIQNIQWQKV